MLSSKPTNFLKTFFSATDYFALFLNAISTNGIKAMTAAAAASRYMLAGVASFPSDDKGAGEGDGVGDGDGEGDGDGDGDGTLSAEEEDVGAKAGIVGGSTMKIVIVSIEGLLNEPCSSKTNTFTVCCPPLRLKLLKSHEPDASTKLLCFQSQGPSYSRTLSIKRSTAAKLLSEALIEIWSLKVSCKLQY